MKAVLLEMNPWWFLMCSLIFGMFSVQGASLSWQDKLKMSPVNVTDAVERIVCIVYLKGGTPHARLIEVLDNLMIVRKQVHSINKKFAEQQYILEALDTLLELKLRQIIHSEKTITTIVLHLKQLKDGLSLFLETNCKIAYDTSQMMFNSNGESENLAIEFLTQVIEQRIQSVSINGNGNMQPAFKKVLTMGSFVLVMLSTTADVCVITGPVLCFALYVAGSGALIIWLAQIYQTTLGINSNTIPHSSK